MNLKEVDMRLEDIVAMKRIVETLVAYNQDKSLFKNYIASVFQNPNGYSEYVLAQVIKSYYPQYLHLLETIVTFS